MNDSKSVDLDKFSMADLYSMLYYLKDKYKKLGNSSINLNTGTPEHQEFLDKRNQLKRSYGRIEWEIEGRLKESGIMNYNPFDNKY